MFIRKQISKGTETLYCSKANFTISLFLLLLSITANLHAQVINNPGRLRVFNNYTFNNDVIIKAGTYVDFRGTIRVATNKKITVEKGAVLRIKNATVTHTSDNFSNTTNSFWGGIVLQGNNTSQDADVNRFCSSNLQSCMNGNDMTFIVGESCLGNSFGAFVNGGLYMDNAKIRYAETGINVQTGGLLYTTNSTYENNRSYSIYMGSLPRAFVQKSLIKSNKFITDFKNAASNYAWTQLFITENYNFYFPISFNEFRHNIGNGSNAASETFFGIQTHYSAVHLQGNTFHNLLCGIRYHAYALTSQSKKIQSNTMYNCYVGIWGGSADISTVTQNTIYPATKNTAKAQLIYGTSSSAPANVTANSPVGILNEGFNNMYADRNNILKYNISYNNEIGILNASPKYSGNGTIFTNANSYYKNKISKMYINAQSQAYPYPSQQLVSKALFKCNTFEGQYYTGFLGSIFPKTYRDMYVTASHSLQAQGTPTSAAGNVFSALSYSGFRNIYNVGYIFNYYYNNSGLQNPSLVTGITKIAAAANSCPNPIDYYELQKSFCTPTYVTPVSGIVVKKGEVKQHLDDYKTTILALEVNGVTPLEKDEYEYVTTLYDIEMTRLIEIYYDEMALDAINPGRYYDSIANYLATHITFAGKYYSIALALDLGDYTLANQYADLLDDWYPSESGAVDLAEYVHLLTDYYTQPEALQTTWLNENFETIKGIADNDDNLASSKAKLWAQYIADVDGLNDYHGQNIYPTYILTDESDAGGGESGSSLVNVTVYPNPFGEQLAVSIENLDEIPNTFVVELYDLNSVLLQSQLSTVNPSASGVVSFNTTSLLTGYYVLKVTCGVEIYNGLVYKQ
jgi:hypothetical protein